MILNINIIKKHAIFVTTLVMIMGLSSCKSKHKVFEDDYGRTERHVKVEKKKTPKEKKTSSLETRLVEEAYSWIGTPYRYGASEKGHGTDCSGMVLKVYENVTGIKIPRNSKKQAEFCRKIDHKEVRPGDLVFFATGKSATTISHVGIMVDKNRFVHSSTKKGVIESEVTTPYYVRTFIMYGRVEK